MRDILDRWTKTASRVAYDAYIFQVRRDSYELDGRKTHDFHVLEAGTWANVVAVTPDDEVVLVRQFRHGIEEMTLEVPGGLVEPGEDPALGAARELVEETGYVGEPPILLTAVSSNPAILTNRTHCYLVENAEQTEHQNPDPNEVLDIVRMPAAEIRAAMHRGEIHHALAYCALAAWLLREAARESFAGRRAAVSPFRRTARSPAWPANPLRQRVLAYLAIYSTADCGISDLTQVFFTKRLMSEILLARPLHRDSFEMRGKLGMTTGLVTEW